MCAARHSDEEVRERIRQLIRGNVAARDQLYAAEQALDDERLAIICRRLADRLGGNAADLEQLLAMAGEESTPFSGSGRVLDLLQPMVAELLPQPDRAALLLEEAAAAERNLKRTYDDALDVSRDDRMDELLRRQRDEVSFGEAVLDKVRRGDEGSREGAPPE